MKKQVAIIGLGRFGNSLAVALAQNGYEVLAIDGDERKVQSISAEITHAVHADGTDESVLEELGIKNFDIVVVAIGTEVQSSVLAAVNLKNMGIPYIIAKANSEAHGQILKKIGVDRVVFPEDDAGNRLAHEIHMRDVSDYLPVTANYGIVKIEAKNELVGQTITELGVGPQGKQEIALLLIRRGNEVIISPGTGEVVLPGDTLIIAGNDHRLEAFLSRIFSGRPG